MKCLRSGYCCIHLDVMIVDNPDLGPVEGNVIHKPTGTSCQHLQGPKAGEYACAVHDREWYPETPCADYTQLENGDQECRMGAYLLICA